VIGGGAMAMTFVDTLLTETGASVVMIDKHHRRRRSLERRALIPGR
jgi:hypothetical protein